MLLDWLIVVILGLVEGITEFLPVSSTGHLLITEQVLGVRKSDLFNVVIQAGAVVAVIPLFWDRIAPLFTCLDQPEVRDRWAKLLVAFGITAAGGLVLEKMHFKLPEVATPIGLALLIGGVLLLGAERWLRHRVPSERIGWAVVLAMGLAQLLAAVFPGASRSGATILFALLLGVGRSTATEFSFLLGIPTLLAASTLKIAKALRGSGPGEDWAEVGLGFVVATFVSFAVVRWLLRYVQTHSFNAIAWYRIVAGCGVLLWMA